LSAHDPHHQATGTYLPREISQGRYPVSHCIYLPMKSLDGLAKKLYLECFSKEHYDKGSKCAAPSTIVTCDARTQTPQSAPASDLQSVYVLIAVHSSYGRQLPVLILRRDGSSAVFANTLTLINQAMQTLEVLYGITVRLIVPLHGNTILFRLKMCLL
jgi:hypothetical protein